MPASHDSHHGSTSGNERLRGNGTLEKIWLKSYEPGVPAVIDPDSLKTLAHVFQQSCQRFRDRPAYANMGRTISFGDLDRLSHAFAAYLQKDVGLRAGDRVAIMMPNLLQYPIAMFAVLRAGLTVVNVNPLYTTRELEHQLKDSGAKAIVILANFAHVLAEVLDKTDIEMVVVTQVGDQLGFPKSLITNLVVRYVKKMVPSYSLPRSIPFNTALRAGERLSLDPVEVTGEDVAFLQYTGGTTGVAKGAMLTHRNMVANLLQFSAMASPLIDEGEEVVITALPLYHIFSLTANCLGYLQHGGLNVLITNPRDMPAFVSELKKWKVSVITGVNTLYVGLLNTPGIETVDFSTYKLVVGGGMSVQEHAAKRWHALTGCPILEGYGLTEASPLVAVNPSNLKEYNGSIGLPVPSTDVSIQDSDNNEVAFGEPGELLVKGPQVMRGYWNSPEETAKTITPDGWLRTGDIATMDEAGFLRIVDRKKDMILVSGFNVFPNEVESVVATHEAVLEVACLGVPHPRSGEAVKVFLVLREGHSVTADEIRDFCKAHLTGYKCPSEVEFRDELPKSNVGKILRRALREE